VNDPRSDLKPQTEFASQGVPARPTTARPMPRCSTLVRLATRVRSSSLSLFWLPLLVLLVIVAHLWLEAVGQDTTAFVLILGGIALGSYPLALETLQSLRRRQYALDYIAILAIVVALAGDEHLVAAIIALMLASGSTLEQYGVARARQSLTRLAERLPNEVVPWVDGRAGLPIKVQEVTVGQTLLVRKGEVIALDGILRSPRGLTDESSLTGEPYEIEKLQGDQLRSGTANIGEPIVLEVTRTGEDSSYRKIVRLVQEAQTEKAPLIRLADRYSTLFTLLALAIAGTTYVVTRDTRAVLAVLVIATPCPLILATPIALLGGVSAAARQRIIVKRLASLEALARVDTVILDKTGTITLGRPELTGIEVEIPELSAARALAIATAIERNSLHPIAKAVVAAARAARAEALEAAEVRETIGSGISGVVDGRRFIVTKLASEQGMAVGLLTEAGETLAIFRFEEQIKPDSQRVVRELKAQGLQLFVFSGDRRTSAERVIGRLGADIAIRAECTPEDKQRGLAELKRAGRVVAMVGDGINDAPALALADVGLVFSNEEQTASSEAADVIFLDGDLVLVQDALQIARATIRIALQSIVWGIGLSTLGMVVAAFGYIPPLIGAFIQEAIDVAVILNSLRAARGPWRPA
jgi:heavy metal translocating P-type ATPase